MSAASLRDYKPGDEENYVHIWNETSKAYAWFAKHGPLTIENARDSIERNRKCETYKLIFAVLDGNAVGFVEAKLETPQKGSIMHYQPCVLPDFQQKGVETQLVEAALMHLRKKGAHKVTFSIMGLPNDTAFHVGLYRSLGFQVWRQAQSMRKSLETIVELQPSVPFVLSTVRTLGTDAFVNFFVECFRDSQDRDASQIASDTERTRKFIGQLKGQEGQRHDPDSWIAAFSGSRFVGFTIATEQEGAGLIAEVGVTPKMRRKGIGAYLTLAAMRRLKERGFKHAYLGVDLQNTAAVSLYEKLGFEKTPFEIWEFEKQLGF